MSARRRTSGYVLWMAALTGLFYALPRQHLVSPKIGQTVVWAAIGVSSTAAVLVGMRVHQTRHRIPWLLLAAALLAFTTGDVIYDVLTKFLGQKNPYPSVADIFYLAMYPLMGASFLVFRRLRTAGRDFGRLLDALTLTVGLTLLSWIFLMVPYLRDPGYSAFAKGVSVAYPLGDVLILATLARLFTGAVRTRAVDLLTLGTIGTLVADVVYGLIQLHSTWENGGPTDLGWALAYTAWGAAALHPSMAELTEAAPEVATGLPPTRKLVGLGMTTLIAPAALLIEAGSGRIDDAPVIAAMSGLTFLMVLLRLAGVVSNHRHALARERGLREASAALVAAANPQEVAQALRTAATRLLSPGSPHRVTVGERSAPAEAAGPFEAAVQYPLTLDDRSGQPRTGGQTDPVLTVAAGRASLAGLQGALEVLASQGALALTRIALTAEINQRNSEAYFRTLVQNAADMILIVDDDDLVHYASPSAEVFFGPGGLAGSPLFDMVHPDQRASLNETVDEIRSGARGARAESSDWLVCRHEGSWLQAEITFQDLRDEPTVRGLVLTLRDVTENRQLEHDLAHQAFHDSLTGLANRVLFTDRVEHALTRANRNGGLVGVLFIDLDDFKVINDTQGHRIGDELLIAVAQRLTSIMRPHDTTARLGGDEFAALIEDATHSAEFEEIAERIVARFGEPFVIDGELINAHASVGIAITTDAATAEDLLRQADLALYMAKGAGKSQWRRYQTTLHTAVVERLELRSALDQAVSEGSFVLHYQPIVEIATGALAGFEALIRWPHPTRGLVPPGQFIEVAEESGLIVPIGLWVLDNALQTMARWLNSAPPASLQYVSVNVSARQFRAPRFVDRVREALDRHAVPPSALLLEITESLLLRDDEQVWADLTALRDGGVRIAIDDFGTGYSSLGYLRKMPIDVLKVDKSFIDDLADSEQQHAVVEAIVRLAQTLRLKVVAEGIEERVQRDLLAEMDCPYGQGYLFSKPLPVALADAWLTPQRTAAV